MKPTYKHGNGPAANVSGPDYNRSTQGELSLDTDQEAGNAVPGSEATATNSKPEKEYMHTTQKCEVFEARKFDFSGGTAGTGLAEIRKYAVKVTLSKGIDRCPKKPRKEKAGVRGAITFSDPEVQDLFYTLKRMKQGDGVCFRMGGYMPDHEVIKYFAMVSGLAEHIGNISDMPLIARMESAPDRVGFDIYIMKVRTRLGEDVRTMPPVTTMAATKLALAGVTSATTHAEEHGDAAVDTSAVSDPEEKIPTPCVPTQGYIVRTEICGKATLQNKRFPFPPENGGAPTSSPANN